MKRFLSIFLSAVFILSLPVYVGAENYVTEVEYNDELYYADVILSGDNVSAFLEYDDTDYFTFDVTEENFVTVTCLSESKDTIFCLCNEYDILTYSASKSKKDGIYEFELTYPVDSGQYYLLFLDFNSYDYSYSFNLKAEKRWDDNHVHKYLTSIIVWQPACAGDGYTNYSCEGCGIKFKDDWVSRAEHEFDFANNYSIDIMPSLTETGFILYPCTNGCGFEYRDEESWVRRIYGRTRYDTSFEIARRLFLEEGKGYFANIIIASGKNFADALAGSYLAKVKNAPIIIASGDNNWDITQFVDTYLADGGTVYILGGSAAVNEELEDYLYWYLGNCNVKRIKGRTRYETNIEILKEAGVTDEEIIVATGNNFADSLSASAVGNPILLVDGKKTDITDIQKNYLETLNTDKFYIVGGEGAVCSEFETVFGQYGSVERIKGATRYETSVKIAEKFFPNASSAILAYAQNFPDGLCGGPLAMEIGAPLILTQTGMEDAAKEYAQSRGIVCGAVLGGASLISDDSTVYIFDNDRDVYVYVYY